MQEARAKTAQPVFTIKAEDESFTVYRDEKPLETPKNLRVSVPTRALAEKIVAECDRQGEKLDLRKMPMTQMTLTALDITASHRAEVITGILRYGETELLCHRATEPADLVAEQNKIWQPYIDWCEKKFGVTLRIGAGITPFEQKPETLSTLRSFVETFSAFPLTGLSEAVGISGSLILGLALATGHITPQTAFEAAELDNLWQAKKWGVDPETQTRHDAIKTELGICDAWLELVA